MINGIYFYILVLQTDLLFESGIPFNGAKGDTKWYAKVSLLITWVRIPPEPVKFSQWFGRLPNGKK